MAGKASLKRAEDFTEFLNASPTPFHAVQSAKLRLEKAGFKQIKVCGLSRRAVTLSQAHV
jgi:aspartyl aminopeptidase